MQRKITDQDIISAMTRIAAGESQKGIAAELGVSPSALNQRIKKQRAYAVPDSFKTLTEKQKRFALAKAEGKTNLEAVKSAYDVTSNESGKALGTQLMKDPDVSLAIQDLLAQEGIPKRRRIQRLRDLIECPDLAIAGKGLDMSFRLTGDYAAEKIDTNAQIFQITADIAAIRKMDKDATQAKLTAPDDPDL